MWDFSLLLAMQAVESSMGVTIYRFFACLKSAGLFLATLVFGAGTGFAIGAKSTFPEVFAMLGGLLGMGVGASWLYRAGKHRLFSVQGTSIAALTSLLNQQHLPKRKTQVTDMKAIIQQRFQNFQTISDLYKCVQCTLVDSVIHFSPVASSLSRLPEKGVTQKITRFLIARLLPPCDSVIVAQCLQDQSNPLEHTIRDTLALFAQNFDLMWKNACWVAGFVFLGWLALFCFMWVPVDWALQMLPSQIDVFWQTVLVLIFSWILKATYFDSVALHALLQVYSKTTAGQSPEAEWVKKLEHCSECYPKLELLDNDKTPV